LFDHFEENLDLFKVNELIKRYADKAFGTRDLFRSTEWLRKNFVINFAQVKKVQMLAVSASHWDRD
jgi:hypothetical protein